MYVWMYRFWTPKSGTFPQLKGATAGPPTKRVSPFTVQTTVFWGTTLTLLVFPGFVAFLIVHVGSEKDGCINVRKSGT